MSNRTFVIGVGMTKFEKPGSRAWDYPDMGREAGVKALADAGIVYRDVESAFVGQWVVNPSGGLISKGHPLGATGLAQCSELTWQIRGQAGKRQVPGVTAALQHNLGLGGAAVVTVYRKAVA